MTYTVETYIKGEEDWVERHRGEDGDAAFTLAQQFTDEKKYYGIRVITIVDGVTWRSVRIAYDYMAGRKMRQQD